MPRRASGTIGRYMSGRSQLHSSLPYRHKIHKHSHSIHKRPPTQEQRRPESGGDGHPRRVREADVPGHRPDGDDNDDYILTSTKMVTRSAPAAVTAQARPGDTPTDTSGIQGPIYEVEGIADQRLRQYIGRGCDATVAPLRRGDDHTRAAI